MLLIADLHRSIIRAIPRYILDGIHPRLSGRQRQHIYCTEISIQLVLICERQKKLIKINSLSLYFTTYENPNWDILKFFISQVMTLAPKLRRRVGCTTWSLRKEGIISRQVSRFDLLKKTLLLLQEYSVRIPDNVRATECWRISDAEDGRDSLLMLFRTQNLWKIATVRESEGSMSA